LLAVVAALLAVIPGTPFAAMARRSFEVQFTQPEGARRAVEELDGSTWEGQPLQVRLWEKSPDQVLVSSSGQLPSWEVVREQFKQVGVIKRWRMKSTATFCEVRFGSPELAEQAVRALDGTLFRGLHAMKLERESEASPRIYVHGLPADMRYAEIQEHLQSAGEIKFMKIHNHDAEVRFSTPDEAQAAIDKLDGSELLGYKLSVSPHHSVQDQDRSKVLVRGLGAGIGWQELKAHFSPVGSVEFVAVGK